MTNNTYYRKTGRLKKTIYAISRHSIRLLHICLPPIFCEALAIIFMFRDSAAECPGAALNYFTPMLEYIMVSLAMTIAGAVILDISEKYDRK